MGTKKIFSKLRNSACLCSIAIKRWTIYSQHRSTVPSGNSFRPRDDADKI